MKVFDDVIFLELLEDDWKFEVSKSKIVLPGTVKERQEGAMRERIPFHFFRVVDVGPDCKKVKIGDRLVPKVPTPECPSMLVPIKTYDKHGKEHVLFETQEKYVAGVE